MAEITWQAQPPAGSAFQPDSVGGQRGFGALIRERVVSAFNRRPLGPSCVGEREMFILIGASRCCWRAVLRGHRKREGWFMNSKCGRVSRESVRKGALKLRGRGET